MKPLRIIIQEDIDDYDSPQIVAFVRPDAILMATGVNNCHDRCAIRTDYDDQGSIIKEPLLEFVARLTEALL